MPYNKLGQINVSIQYYFENIIIKQLLREPASDRFAVAFYIQQQDEEPNCTLVFKQGDSASYHGWHQPQITMHKNEEIAIIENLQEVRAEKLINSFHIDSEHGQKFLLFRDETLLIVNESNMKNVSIQKYQEIDMEIIQLRVIKEDFGGVGETFLCAFQVLHSNKVCSSAGFEIIREAYVAKRQKEGASKNEVFA